MISIKFDFSTLLGIPATLISVILSLSTSASAFSLGDYNLIVFEDLNSNSEVEGSAFIGGDLRGNSSNYCIQCSPGGSFVPLNNVGLKVVGNIEGTTKQVNNGTDLEYGGSLNTTVIMNGGGSQTQNPELANEFAQLRNELINQSILFSNLASNSSVSIPAQQPGPVNFNSSGDKIAVFDISADDLFSNRTQQIQLNLNGSSTAIINVSGPIGNWTQGNIVGDLVTDEVQELVLWNFYEAETLNFNLALHGSLLAPLASLTNQTELEGTIVVKSFAQNGEVHLPVYAGESAPIPEIPEPSTILALGTISALAGVFKTKLTGQCSR